MYIVFYLVCITFVLLYDPLLIQTCINVEKKDIVLLLNIFIDENCMLRGCLFKMLLQYIIHRSLIFKH